jgi:hypothetical protein
MKARGIIFNTEGKQDKMKTLTEPEIKNMLLRLYWDVKVEPEQLLGLLKGDVERIGYDDIFYGRPNSLAG